MIYECEWKMGINKNMLKKSTNFVDDDDTVFK